MFTKDERSTFKYWFAHWCAFQMTALNLRCWKFKYLFHDIEKPWLKLIWSYDKVKKWHRYHSKHHPEWLERNKGICDWEAMMIDWECSRFTKQAQQNGARIQLTLEHTTNKKWGDLIWRECILILDKWGI